MESPVSMPSADPFFPRCHSFLYVTYKRLYDVPLAKRISRWMSDTFGAGVASENAARLARMEERRTLLRSMSERTLEQFVHDTFERSELPAAVEYLSDLESLLRKTQGTPTAGSVPGLQFVADHWLGHDVDLGPLATCSLRFEMCCVMFNLAAGFAISGCRLPPSLKQGAPSVLGPAIRTASSSSSPSSSSSASASLSKAASAAAAIAPRCDSAEGLQHRCRAFVASASLFELLRARLVEWPDVAAADELSPEPIAALASAMIAQARECFYQLYKHRTSGSAAAGALAQQPESHAQCAALALAAVASYTAFGQQAGAEAVCAHLPVGYWTPHCEAVRALLRVCVLRHHSRSIETSPTRHGYRVGYARKCCAILEEQLRSLRAAASASGGGGESLEALRALIEARLADANATFAELRRDNDAIYRASEPIPAEIDALELQPNAVISVNDLARSENEHLKRLASIGSPSAPPPYGDAFPTILSFASARGWMEYRRRRIERYSEHASRFPSCWGLDQDDDADGREPDAAAGDTLASVLHAHPEYAALYFWHHRRDRQQQQQQRQQRGASDGIHRQEECACAPALSNELAAWQKRSLSQSLLQLGDEVGDAYESTRRAVHGMRRAVRTVVERTEGGADVVQQRQDLIDREADFCLESRAVRLLRRAYAQIRGRLLAVTSRALRPQPASDDLVSGTLPDHAASRAPPSAGVSRGGRGNGSGRGPGLGEQATPLAEAARLVAQLVDECYLAREQIEDELAKKLLTDLDEPEHELAPVDLADLGAWIGRRLGWLDDAFRRAQALDRAEAKVLVQLGDLEFDAAAVLSALDDESSAFCGASVDDTSALPQASREPCDLLRNALIGIKCRRYLLLMKRLHETVAREAEVLREQCEGLIESLADRNAARPAKSPSDRRRGAHGRKSTR